MNYKNNLIQVAELPVIARIGRDRSSRLDSENDMLQRSIANKPVPNDIIPTPIITPVIF